MWSVYFLYPTVFFMEEGIRFWLGGVFLLWSRVIQQKKSKSCFLELPSDGLGFFFFHSFKTGTSGWTQACVSWHLGLSSNRQACLACFGSLCGPISLCSSFLTSKGLVRRKKANIKDSVYTLWFKVRWEIIMALEADDPEDHHLMTWGLAVWRWHIWKKEGYIRRERKFGERLCEKTLGGEWVNK